MYWFWYGYLWFAVLLIPTIVILWAIGELQPMIIARAAWIIPFGLWYGWRQIKRERGKAAIKFTEKLIKESAGTPNTPRTTSTHSYNK